MATRPDHEEPVVWKHAHLNVFEQVVDGIRPPFHPLSSFAGPQGGPTLRFPRDLLYSDNFFKSSWHGKGVRRLKSTICMIEWIPDLAAPARICSEPDGMLGERGNQDEGKREMYTAFQTVNSQRRPSLCTQDAVQLLRSVDVDVEAEEAEGILPVLLDALSDDGGVSYDAFKSALQDQTYYRFEDGRFFVAVSLEEAAGLRALLHTYRQYEQGQQAQTKKEEGDGDGEGNGDERAAVPCLALRLCSSGVMLDSSDSFAKGPTVQLHRAVQCFRFANGESQYSDLAERTLMRGIQRSPGPDRRSFWMQMQTLRRRDRSSARGEQLARIFHYTSELGYLLTAVLGHRLMTEFASRKPAWGFMEAHAQLASEQGVLDMQAFQKQVARLLNQEEHIEPEHIQPLFGVLDADKDGQISYPEFKAGMLSVVERAPHRTAADDADAMLGLVTGPAAIEIQWFLLSRIELCIAQHAELLEVGTFASPFRRSTLVAPVLDNTLPGVAALGSAFASIDHRSAMSVLQVTCRAAFDVADMLEVVFFPQPIGFDLVASVQVGRSMLYVWNPRALRHFTALGMVMTLTAQPPPLNSIRTLPTSLTRNSERPPLKIHDTNPPIYTNSLGLIVVPSVSGAILNRELITESLTLQDAFVFTTRR